MSGFDATSFALFPGLKTFSSRVHPRVPNCALAQVLSDATIVRRAIGFEHDSWTPQSPDCSQV